MTLSERRLMIECLCFLVLLGVAGQSSAAADEARAGDVSDSPESLSNADSHRHCYQDYVRVMADNMIRFGRDRYGSQSTPLFASILDVKDLECPQEMTLYAIDASRLDPGRYANRCAVGGGNIYFDQAMLQSFADLSEVTGKPQYNKAAVDAVRYALLHATDAKGFPAMGGHTYWHFYKDQPEAQGEYHELWNWPMAWNMWWEADHKGLIKYGDLVWKWHVVDKKTGETNRHSDGHHGFAFTFSDASFISLWSFLGEKTGDPKYRDWCRLVIGYHWNLRNPQTNLFPSSGGKYVILKGRADTQNFTTMQATLAYHLIVAGNQLNAPDLAEKGLAILKSYAEFGYDPNHKSYYGMLSLDGTPVNADAKRDPVTGTDFPAGDLAIWQPHAAWHEEPLEMARAYVFAARKVDDPVLRQAANRFGEAIRRAWKHRYANFPTFSEYSDALNTNPSNLETYQDGVSKTRFRNSDRVDQVLLDQYRNGGYRDQAPFDLFADHYGQTIEFAVSMHDLTGEQCWLDFAREVADTAITQLWHETIFVGHPSKHHYMSTDNVGILLHALLRLDLVLNGQPDIGTCL